MQTENNCQKINHNNLEKLKPNFIQRDTNSRLHIIEDTSKHDGDVLNKDMKIFEKLITPTELARYLSCSVGHVYNKKDEIPHIKIGRLLRFKRNEIEKWLLERSR